jgi:hypothetical protein
MIQTDNCDVVVEHLSPYVEGILSKPETAGISAHLQKCGYCRDAVDQVRAVHGLLGNMPAAALKHDAPDAFLEVPVENDGWRGRLSAAPWWAVSVVLHILVILLAGLISMSIELPRPEDPLVTVTELQPAPKIEAKEEKKTEKPVDALASKHDTPPTDPNSKENSDIVVPPDIMQKAIVGDHFETVNPDMPNDHSAFGNPDAHMFHSVTGNDDAEGGGGTGGSNLQDSMIGVGASGSPGSGGGWGGGTGTGTGVGTGGGHGSFGQRGKGGRVLMVKKHGGSKQSEGSVDLALKWLAYHQEADGHWDSAKYGGREVDVGVTGLALLAFLGAGHTEKVGEYKNNVQRAVKWLISHQAANGRIGIEGKLDSYGGGGYGAAISTLAISEAAGMANIKETKEAAQKAINYCTEIHQQGEGSEKGAWRYNAKSEPDTSVTGWFIMALKSAKVAGLQVNHASFEGAMKYLDAVEEKNAGQGDYGPASRYNYMKGKHHTRRTTAIGILARQFLGVQKEQLQSSCALMITENGTPAKWSEHGTDMYYWYYGTLAMFQQGDDLWKKWNEDMKPTLIDNQCKQGDDAGSWPVIGVYSDAWGRVGQTALGALCLEVYYRYVKLAP